MIRLLSLALMVALTACATTKGDKKSPKKSKSSSSSRFSKAKPEKSAPKSKPKAPRANLTSARRATLIQSLSNNKMTSKTISSSRADQRSASLPSSSRDKSVLEAKLSAQRLARKSFATVNGTARKIALLEMSKNADRKVDDAVKLELALAAVGSKQFAMADYYLQSLITSKNARVRAGAYNALGVIALRDNRIPEAIGNFKSALKAVSSYRPAKLNLGFTALRGGDIATAKRQLGSLQDDWFVQYGLISVAKMEGDAGRVKALCDRVLAKQPNHKPSLYNCALALFQLKKDVKTAKKYLAKLVSIPGGGVAWDEKAYLLQNKIEVSKAKRGPAKQVSGKK